MEWLTSLTYFQHMRVFFKKINYKIIKIPFDRRLEEII
jgi:hypothetical protein